MPTQCYIQMKSDTRMHMLRHSLYCTKHIAPSHYDFITYYIQQQRHKHVHTHISMHTYAARYLSHCLKYLISSLHELIPSIATSILDELQRTAAAKKPVAPGSELKTLRPPLSLIPVLLHATTSPSTRSTINGVAIKAVAGFLATWCAVFACGVG